MNPYESPQPALDYVPPHRSFGFWRYLVLPALCPVIFCYLGSTKTLEEREGQYLAWIIPYMGRECWQGFLISGLLQICYWLWQLSVWVPIFHNLLTATP